MIPQLDATDLRTVFGRDVASYEIDSIDPHLRIHSVTGGVYRVRVGTDSCVIKVVRHGTDATADGLWQSGAEVSHRNYWKREWLAFDSGLLEALPGRLRAPRNLLTTEHEDGTCWIWMEDVVGRTGSELALSDLEAVGYALGTTNGAYASHQVEVPDEPWLSRNWLRTWVDVCSPLVDIVRDDDRWADRRLGPLLPTRERVDALWSRREELLAIAHEPPASVTHWDLWPTNFFVSDEGDVVAIDWSQVGISGVTHDLDQITLDTVWMQVRPQESLVVLEERVLAAYIAGLLESGYAARRHDIHRWYAATAALRYAWLGGTQPDVLADPDMVRFHESRFRRDIASITTTKARVIEHALDLGESVLGR